MSIEETFFRAIEGQRDEARLNAIYWRNKYEAECESHRHTQKRLEAFVNGMANNMAMLCNPPVMVLDKDGVHRESLDAAVARVSK